MIMGQLYAFVHLNTEQQEQSRAVTVGMTEE
jgi:hypothetical protein